jgi:hypothetical protein
MRATIGMLVFAAATLGTAAPGQAQHRRPLLGSQVRLELYDGSGMSGELLAVQQDSVWLLVRGEMRVIPLGGLERVQVRRPGIDATDILLWTVVGGAATGGALTAACSSVSEGCGPVFVVTLVLWWLVGGIAAENTQSPDRWLRPDSAALAPYARFPQGLPPGFVPNPP